MFARTGQFCFRRRWYVIALWLVLAIVAIPVIPLLPGQLAVGGFSSSGTETAEGFEFLQENIEGFNASSLIIIFQDDELTAHNPAFIEQSEQVIQDVLTIPEAVDSQSFSDNPRQISDDGHTAYTVVSLTIPGEEAQRLMPDVDARIEGSPLEIYVAGGPAFYDDIERVSEQDLRRAELIAVPFALIALVFVFRSLGAASVPLMVGGISVASVLGFLFAISYGVNLSIFILNLATMLGLGLAIDYSLFITSRFREELDKTEDLERVISSTIDTAGRAVFFSGLTVMLGLGGLMIFDFMFLRSIGVAGSLVVAFAVAGALTLLPAILGVLGHQINRFPVLRRKSVDGRFWERLAGFVMRNPWKVLLPVIAFLFLLGSPFLNVRLSSQDATILPESTDSREAFEVLRSEFSDGEISPIILAIKTNGPVNDPDNLAALYDLSREIAQDERVWRIDSIVSVDHRISLEQYQLLYQDPERLTDPFLSESYDLLSGNNATVMYVYTPYLPASNEAKDLVQDFRDMSLPGGLDMQVTGGTAEILDIVDSMYGQFPIAILIVVLTTYVALLIHFRSVLLPLKAILINALSITASYGALVWIFQEGNLSQLLGFTPAGYIEATLPILMFCMLFGLSMDYEVFLLSRMREVWDETGDNARAVATGLARSGQIITGAALIVVVVTVSFVSAEVLIIKALGLGIAIAVAVDASIVRSLVVPATMRLFGTWNWWAPEWLLRILPHSPFDQGTRKT